MWYVITGASGSGKSTIIMELEKKGHNVVHESARTLIEREVANGKTIEEIRKDEQIFQQKVLEMKIEIEKSLSHGQLTFFDRGIPDTEAYSRLYGFDHSQLQEIMKSCKYKKIFLLDRLPYSSDHVRIETSEQQDLLHQYIEEAYRNLGFEIIKVPVLSVDERIDFILKNI